MTRRLLPLLFSLAACAVTESSPRATTAPATDLAVAAAAGRGQRVGFHASRDEHGLTLYPDHDVACEGAPERARQTELLVATLAQLYGVERVDLDADPLDGHRGHTFECFQQRTPGGHLPTAYHVCITRRLADGAYAWVSVALSREMATAGRRATITPPAARAIARAATTRVLGADGSLGIDGSGVTDGVSLDGDALVYRVSVMRDDMSSVVIVVDAESGVVRGSSQR